MIKTIEHNNKRYPLFQSQGNASQFAIPFAKHVCVGYGYDIGCCKEDWAFPGAMPIDIELDDEWHALNLPEEKADYIFSSHCLEHINDWVSAADYWYEKLKKGGTLFLYLPDYSQEYWRPWSKRKHVNILSPQIIKDYMKHKGYINIFTSGVDLNNSFMAMAEIE